MPFGNAIAKYSLSIMREMNLFIFKAVKEKNNKLFGLPRVRKQTRRACVRAWSASSVSTTEDLGDCIALPADLPRSTYDRT